LFDRFGGLIACIRVVRPSRRPLARAPQDEDVFQFAINDLPHPEERIFNARLEGRTMFLQAGPEQRAMLFASPPNA
jgi:hypothetical protein